MASESDLFASDFRDLDSGRSSVKDNYYLLSANTLHQIVFSSASITDLTTDLDLSTGAQNDEIRLISDFSNLCKLQSPTIWRDRAEPTTRIILNALSQNTRNMSSIRNALYMIRELLSYQSTFLHPLCTEILLAILQFETESKVSFF